VVVKIQSKKKKDPIEISEQMTDVEDSVDLDVDQLPGIGETYAKRLHDSGVFTIIDLSSTTPREVMDITSVDEEVATNIVNKAKEIMVKKDVIAKSIMTATELMAWRQREIAKIPTGSSKLDELLGGGIETESITEFYGLYGSGKTQICFSLATRIQLPIDQGGLNATVLWIDTENTFRPERIVQIAMELGKTKEEAVKFLDNITVLRAFNSAHQIQLINQLSHFLTEDLNNKTVDDPKPRLLIIDSLTAHFRTEFLGRGTLQNRQSKIGAMMKKISRVIETWKLACVVTNQVMNDPSTPGFMDSIKPVGGNLVGHLSTYRLYIKKSGKKRVVRMVDSPSHPEMDCLIELDAIGVKNGAK